MYLLNNPENPTKYFMLMKRFTLTFEYYKRNSESMVSEAVAPSCSVKKLLKNRLWHRCFAVNFVKFSKAPISQNTSERFFRDMMITSKLKMK